MSRWNDQLIPEHGPGDVKAAERDAAIEQVSGRLANIRATYADLEAASHAAVTGSAGVRVAVSKTPPVPVDVDRVDLTGRANPLSAGVAAWTEDPEDAACQIGHVAVASELLFWANDWAPHRREVVACWDVPMLCRWIDYRLEWAYDHPEIVAWDELASALDRIARALRGTLTPRGRRSVPVSAPCPREGCAGVLGRRDDGWVECGDDECGRILSADEYVDWSRIAIAKAAGDGWGITAREIQLTALTRDGKTRSLGTIYSWASRHKWTKADGRYDREHAARTVALVEAREAREAEAVRVT